MQRLRNTSRGAYYCDNFDVRISTDVLDSVKLVYNTLAYLLVMRCEKVNTSPLVAAGTKYIHLFQEASNTSKTGKNVKPLVELILDEMQQERDADWIFYELLSGIFNIQIDDADQKKIEKAKEHISAGKIDI